MNKSYENITLEALILDDYFIDWVKYPTEESNLFWGEFRNQNLVNQKLIVNARLAVESLIIASKPHLDETDKPSIWTNLQPQIEVESETKLKFWIRWSAAASILLFLGFGIWHFINKSTDNQQVTVQSKIKSNENIEIKNTTKIAQKITFSDKSIVVLKPNSSITYQKDFKGNNREVYLSGEAFFDVKKNPAKPFIVYANDVITKVLGTSFNIKAFQNQEVLVTVKTGKVSVFYNYPKKNTDLEVDGIVLTPNQQVLVSADNENFKRTIVAIPLPIILKADLEKFNFNDAPINEIFEAIKEVYGIEIVFDKDVLVNCNLTTSLTNESLFQKLDIICEGIGATYKVVDAQIIVSSNGCN